MVLEAAVPLAQRGKRGRSEGERRREPRCATQREDLGRTTAMPRRGAQSVAICRLRFTASAVAGPKKRLTQRWCSGNAVSAMSYRDAFHSGKEGHRQWAVGDASGLFLANAPLLGSEYGPDGRFGIYR